ncbi:hypothetical protein [Picrophilus oshimae]|nr:hypothetical protein [Picrophilus oshimae]
MHKNKVAIVLIAIIVILSACLIAVNENKQLNYSPDAIGSSRIIVSESVLNVTAGSSIYDNYTVRLVSGTTWGTYINYKTVNGISVSFSNSGGDPTYTGTMNIHVSGNVSPGSYIISLYATGDDPSPYTNVTVNVIAHEDYIKIVSEKTLQIKDAAGGNLSLTYDNVTLLVNVRPGTYAFINGTYHKNYNFTLVIFNDNGLIKTPAGYNNYTINFIFAFEVNGIISQNISLVNSTGSGYPVITYMKSPENWISWTYIGGMLSGKDFYPQGGSYRFIDKWTYNKTMDELVNDQFYKPVLWVVMSPVHEYVQPAVYRGFIPYISAVAVIIAILIILSTVFVYMPGYAKKSPSKINRIFYLYISMAFEFSSMVYLIIYDKFLRTAAPLHYDFLIAAFIISIALLVPVVINKYRKAFLITLGSLSILAWIGLIIDAELNLPFSSVHSSIPNYGWEYLFGFGTGAFSSFNISMGFSVFFVSIIITGIISIYISMND